MVIFPLPPLRMYEGKWTIHRGKWVSLENGEMRMMISLYDTLYILMSCLASLEGE